MRYKTTLTPPGPPARVHVTDRVVARPCIFGGWQYYVVHPIGNGRTYLKHNDMHEVFGLALFASYGSYPKGRKP